MKLIVQPGDGIAPLIKAINRAKKSIEIAIFRFDHREVERALINAANRGVSVHGLIAYTNHGGERSLRNLEMRLLAGGVTVSRTGDDLIRYHDKFMIVDRRELYLLAFNFTYLDIEHSRSFGVITRNRAVVQEAVKLFEADATRQPYLNGASSFVVSPVNARKKLTEFLRGSKKELFIYDPEISDRVMIRLLEHCRVSGVQIKILGKVARGELRARARKLAQMRLHARVIIRDGSHAFIGSQSLREMELEKRREAGIILRDRKVVDRLRRIFEEDWELAQERAAEGGIDAPPEVAKAAKKLAKAVESKLPPIAPLLGVVVKEADPTLELNPRQVDESVKQAVKEAVKEAVLDVVERAGSGHK